MFDFIPVPFDVALKVLDKDNLFLCYLYALLTARNGYKL